MGKASKWVRALFGLKRSDKKPDPAQNPPPAKKKWSFTKSHKDKDTRKSQHGVLPEAESDTYDSEHAIAVAAATAAVAEAAVAAAQAAAAVVKLTSGGRKASSAAGGGSRLNSAAYFSESSAGCGRREEWAAVTIQSHFRAYLARRALRALKALVKLQALVRGHILRKQTADILRRMQALARVQARARAGRVNLSSEAAHNHFNHKGPPTPEKLEHARSAKHEYQPMMLKRNGHRKTAWEQGSFTRIIRMDGETSDQSLGKPHVTPKRKSHLSHSSNQHSTSKDSTSHLSPSSESLMPQNFRQDIVVESGFCAAQNSPQFYSASSMGGSSMKSERSRSYLSGYSDHPNYMAYTKSSKAKVRSLSAPKLRPQYERSSSANRFSIHGYGDSRFNNAQKVPALHYNFANKAYPGSGRLDRLGMPVRGDVSGFSGGHLLRYW